MKMKMPETSIINPPHKIEGAMNEAEESFYKLAKNKIKFVTKDEMIKWHEKHTGEKNTLTTASFIICYNTETTKAGNLEKWIHGLEIIVDKDIFYLNGIDYSDLSPFIVEHEIFESWLDAKKGMGPSIPDEKKHLLALRRAFLFAEQNNLGDKLFEFSMIINPTTKEECKNALDYAKKKLKSN